MSWRHVVSLIFGFIAAAFGLKWFASQRREDKALVDQAREEAKRERKRIDALERLKAKAVEAKLKAELERLTPKPREGIDIDDALDVLNGEVGDDAGPAADTE